jgi:hypothetical protein
MSGDIIGLITLSITLTVHLITTVWWAASITRRVEHIEQWVASNSQTAERLASLENQVGHIGGGINRIEDFLRYGK